MAAPRAGAALAWLAGACFAGLLMVGRTDLARLSPTSPRGPLMELRLYLVVALGLLVVGAMAVGREGPDRTAGPSPDWRAVGLLLVSLLGAGASFVWSWGDDAAVVKLYEVFLVVVSAGLVALLARAWPEESSEGFWVAVLGFGILLAALGVRALGSAATGEGRLAVLGGGPNVFGRLMGLLGMACLWQLGRCGRWARVWLIGLAGIAGMLGLLTGSRGALVGFSVGLALYVWVERVPVRRVLGVFVAGLLVLVPVVAALGIWSRMYDIIQNRFVGLLVKRVYTAGRGALLDVALDRSAAALGAGHGLASFGFRGFHYPHNLVVELLYEAGLLAASALVAGALWLLFRLVRDRRAGLGPAAGAWAMILAASMFSGDLYDARGVFLLPLLLLFTPAARGDARLFEGTIPR